MNNIFQNIKNVVFDLDGTLYPNSKEIEKEFLQQGIEFLVKFVGLSLAEAIRLSKEWGRIYGGEMEGIKQFPNVNPQEFMEYLCEVELAGVNPNPELNTQLKALSQNIYIFTDSTRKHVLDTLVKLGIDKEFNGIFTSQEGGYLFKPHEKTFRSMLEYFKLQAHECLFVDDRSPNIEAAHQLGMMTIFISSEEKLCLNCDYSFPNINEALAFVLKDTARIETFNY